LWSELIEKERDEKKQKNEKRVKRSKEEIYRRKKLLKISVVISFSYSLCELFSYHDFDIEIINISDCIFIETFDKCKMIDDLHWVSKFLWQNTTNFRSLLNKCCSKIEMRLIRFWSDIVLANKLWDFVEEVFNNVWVIRRVRSFRIRLRLDFWNFVIIKIEDEWIRCYCKFLINKFLIIELIKKK